MRILGALGGPTTPWVLTGGAAVAAVAGHRTTRDLDLVCREADEIAPIAAEQERLLRADGLDVTVLQTAPMFRRLRVGDGSEVTIVDLTG